MNLRPSGYEPDELPGCSTPRCLEGPGWAGARVGACCLHGGVPGGCACPPAPGRWFGRSGPSGVGPAAVPPPGLGPGRDAKRENV